MHCGLLGTFTVLLPEHLRQIYSYDIPSCRSKIAPSLALCECVLIEGAVNLLLVGGGQYCV